MEPSPDSTTLLLARANLARSRLASTLAALDRRRREMTNLPLLVAKHRGAVVIVTACTAGVVLYAVVHAAFAARRRRLGRWTRLQRAWSRPEPEAKKPGALVTIAKALAVQAARVLVAKLLTFEREGPGEIVDRAPAAP